MTEPATERLRELLGKATPGPWSSFTEFPTRGGVGSGGVYVGTAFEMGRTVCTVPDPLSADAAYIAACDPDSIRALLDAHDRMAGALQTVGDWLDEFYGPVEYEGMTQFDHGHGEYEARMKVALTVRAALAVPKEENPDA